jgi:inner membrane protein
MRFPFLAKLTTVGAVALLVLVPLIATRGKIEERQRLNNDARRSIVESSAGEQRLIAPVLRVGCIETYTEVRTISERGRDQTVRQTKERECEQINFAPEVFEVSGRVDLEQMPRYRGIHRVRLYRAPLKLAGRFVLPEAPEQVPDTVRRFGRAQLVLPVADARGVKNTPQLKIGGNAVDFKPGTGSASLGQGLSASLGNASALGREAAFAFDLELAGVERFSVVPFARNTVVKLDSNWPAPSFTGKFLPDERTVSETGFGAEWRINEFASGGQAALREWLAKPAAEQSMQPQVAALTINLIEPVNLYLQAYRAAEYGFLFVGLTFLLVLAFELAGSARVHPVQYGLVGLALAVFFLLLIALAEHIGFARAYLAAASACVLLITWYAIGMLGSAKRGAAVGASSAALFGVLNMLLRSEDYALLMGALLVFAVLAALMLATRRLDWYGLGERLKTAA